MVGTVNSVHPHRLAKFCFDRPEFKDRLASTSPKGWGMLKEKFIKDQGKRTYLDKANIELNTVQLVTDANGNLSFAAAGVASPVSTPDGGTGLTAAGAVGNLLTSNGTIWTSAVPAPGGAGYFQGNNGITGDSTNGLADIFRVNSGTLTVSTTIAASTNASCTGPFGVDPSVTLSVAGVLAII